MNPSRFSNCGSTAGKILTVAALLFAFCTPMQMSAQTPLTSPVEVGPNPLPNPIPAGTTPTAPTLGIPYTDPIPPQLWLWNNAAQTMPTIRLQTPAVSPPNGPLISPGGSLWGLARPSNRLSSLSNGGQDPDVVFKADGDTKDLIFTNLGSRGGGIRFATTVPPVVPGPGFTEKERVTIQNNGNVIFNPDAPNGRVQVNGHFMWTGELRPGGSAGAPGQFLLSQGPGQPPIWSSTLPGSGGSGSSDPWFITGNSNTDATNFLGTTTMQPLIMKTNDTERLRITKDGFVGIGTLGDPLHLFEVKGWGQVVGQFTGGLRTTLDIVSIANTAPGTDDGNAQIRFINQPDGGTAINGSWMVGMDAEDDFKFKIAPLLDSKWYGSSTFVIQPNGRIGIGTNDPMEDFHVWGRVRIGEKGVTGTHSDARLAVDGKIAARSVVCRGAIDWADFVFDENYDLMPLEEVAQSIKENKHLPGIPSAAEVQEEGIDLVEMQSKLLQKIEEITLYMIELKSENRRLQQEVDALKNTLPNTGK